MYLVFPAFVCFKLLSLFVYKKPLLFLFLILAFLFFNHVTVEVGKQCSLGAQNTIYNQGTTIHLPYITIHLLNSPDLRITRII